MLMCMIEFFGCWLPCEFVMTFWFLSFLCVVMIRMWMWLSLCLMCLCFICVWWNVILFYGLCCFEVVCFLYVRCCLVSNLMFILLISCCWAGFFFCVEPSDLLDCVCVLCLFVFCGFVFVLSDSCVCLNCAVWNVLYWIWCLNDCIFCVGFEMIKWCRLLYDDMLFSYLCACGIVSFGFLNAILWVS